MPIEGFIEPGPPPPSIVNPDWQRKPGGDDLARYYPEAAMRQELGGRATISCAVTEAGDVERCVVVSEDPEGLEFGAAALKLAPLFKMRPKSLDGIPVEGTVRIPIVFRVPEAPPPAPPPSPEAIREGALLASAVLLGVAVVAALLLAGLYALFGRRRKAEA